MLPRWRQRFSWPIVAVIAVIAVRAMNPSPDPQAAYQPRDELYLWWLAHPSQPRLIGDLSLVAYFGDRDRSFRLKVTGHFGAT